MEILSGVIQILPSLASVYMRKCNTYLILYLDPPPCVPNRQYIEHKSYKDQKLVIRGWVGGQSGEIENKKDSGDDDIYPAIHRIVQRQRQENHNNRDHH